MPDRTEKAAAEVDPFREEFRLIDEHEPVLLKLKRSEAFMLLSQIQLALRHPDNNGVTAEWARQLAKTLEGVVSVSPAIASLAKLGWGQDEPEEKPCPWCKTLASDAAKHHEGPHATWCPHYQGSGGGKPCST